MTDYTTEYLGVRQLVEKYIDAVNRRSAADWAATWAPEGTWDLAPGRAVAGRDAIVPMWEAAMAGLPMAILVLHGGVITGRDGDVCTSRWYIGEYLKGGDGTPRMVIGCYHDTCRLVDGQWRFVKRAYNPLYSGAPDLTGDVMPVDVSRA